MRITFAIILFMFAGAVWANNLIIKAKPEDAELYAKSLEGGEFKKLGDAPFDANIEDVIKKIGGSEIFILEIRKKGYATYRIVIPKLQKADMALNVELKRDDNVEIAKQIDKVVTKLFEAQRMIRGKNYTDANKVIEDVEKEFPTLSVSKELMASSYYLEKDYKKALDMYSKAYSANAENIDALKMIKFLEKSMGITTQRASN